MFRIHIVPTIIKEISNSSKEDTMKAFLFDESNHWVPFDKNLTGSFKGSFKFLYYILSEEKILLLVSTRHPGKIAHSDLHEKSALFIPEGQKPIGAGLFSAQRKVIENWESFTMDIVTSKEYRAEISEFLLR